MMYNDVNANKVTSDSFHQTDKAPRCIRRFEHSGVQSTTFIISSSLTLLMGLYMLMLNNTASNSLINAARTPLGYWVVDGFTWFLCGYALVAGVMFMIHGISIRRHALSVTEAGINGTTAGVFGMNPVTFDMTWDQLEGVKKAHSSQLKVWGPTGRYTLYLNGCYDAVELIDRKLRESRRESRRANRDDKPVIHHRGIESKGTN